MMSNQRPPRRPKRAAPMPTSLVRFSRGARPPVLQSERADEFEALLKDLTLELKPQGIIEETCVEDIAQAEWEISRLRRCKTAIVRANYRSAIRAILERSRVDPYEIIDLSLADKWFSSEQAKKDLLQYLVRFQLDESTIEAEALLQSLAAIEGLDKLLTGLETRRGKALACIAAYRHSFGDQLREIEHDIIEGDVDRVPRLRASDASIAAE
jgi:hypothetical protein